MTPDKGLGVFAAEFIPANTIVMGKSTGTMYYDKKEALEYLTSLPSWEEKQYWISHVYEVRNKIIKDAYDQDIVNHSTDPNIFYDYDDDNSIALRDIEEGEELTEDYRNEPSPFLTKLRGEYGVPWDFIYT